MPECLNANSRRFSHLQSILGSLRENVERYGAVSARRVFFHAQCRSPGPFLVPTASGLASVLVVVVVNVMTNKCATFLSAVEQKSATPWRNHIEVEVDEMRSR